MCVKLLGECLSPAHTHTCELAGRKSAVPLHGSLSVGLLTMAAEPPRGSDLRDGEEEVAGSLMAQSLVFATLKF